MTSTENICAPEVEPASREEYVKERRAKAINEVMNGFDFIKAVGALKGCNWRYYGADQSPTEADLRKRALKLVQGAAEGGPGGVYCSGPLQCEAKCFSDREAVALELSLIPVCSSHVFLDGQILWDRKKKEARHAKKGKPKL